MINVYTSTGRKRLLNACRGWCDIFQIIIGEQLVPVLIMGQPTANQNVQVKP